MKKTLSALFALSLFSGQVFANELNHEEVCPAFWESTMSDIYDVLETGANLKSKLDAETDFEAGLKLFEFMRTSPELLKETAYSLDTTEEEVIALVEVGEIMANHAKSVFFDTREKLNSESSSELYWDVQCKKGNFDEMINIALNDEK